MKTNKSIMDFSSVNNFAVRYLNTYYRVVDSDEVAITKFLVRQYRKINRNVEILEIGCGPTIHHLIPAIPYAKKIVMADFLNENLYQIKKWIDRDITAHNWNNFTKLALQFEGVNASIEEIAIRENKLRSLINLAHCNLMKDSPLDGYSQFSIVCCFYCAEGVGISKLEWANVIRRVASLILPGGYLFLVSLRDTDFYKLIDHSGKEEIFPSASITEKDILNLLPSIGFSSNTIEIEVEETPNMKHYGVNGIILVSAQKGGCE